jgi:hypothetical protein
MYCNPLSFTQENTFHNINSYVKIHGLNIKDIFAPSVRFNISKYIYYKKSCVINFPVFARILCVLYLHRYR